MEQILLGHILCNQLILVVLIHCRALHRRKNGYRRDNVPFGYPFVQFVKILFGHSLMHDEKSGTENIILRQDTDAFLIFMKGNMLVVGIEFLVIGGFESDHDQ